MATSFQRRPDNKALQELFDPKKKDSIADLQKVLHELPESLREGQKQGARVEADAEVSADLAAQLQPAMGNHAVQALLKRPSESDGVAGEQEEQEQQEEESGKEEGEDKEKGGVERSLPTFSAGAAGPGAPPWAMGHYFGGDDDDDVDLAEDGPRWRPMPYPPDPDEDEEIEIDDAGGEAPPAEPDTVDLRDADASIGRTVWESTLLSRGLRWPARLARSAFSPEALVDHDGAATSLGRARTMLRFLANQADHPDALLLARTAMAAGEALLVAEGGFSGAVARNLGMVELCLRLLPEPGIWENILELRLDLRARPRTENAAGALAEGHPLTAETLLAELLGVPTPTAEDDPVFDSEDEAHPAALAALEAVIRPDPIPAMDLWSPNPVAEPPEAALAAVEAAIQRILGGDPVEAGLVHEDELAPVYDSLNALLTTMGAMQIEVTTAVLAVWPYADADRLVALAANVDQHLRGAARRLVEVGQAIETRVDSREIEAVKQLSAEAVAIRNLVEILRRATLRAFAALIGPAPDALPTAPAPAGLARAEALWGYGRGAQAREAILDQDLDLLPGRAQLSAAGLLLTMGFPADAGPLLERAARALLVGEHGAPAPELALGALIMRTGLHLAAGELDRVEHLAATSQRLAARLGLVYAEADAVMSLATARAATGGDWREALGRAASSLREAGGGGPFNLVKARWAELGAAEHSPPHS